MALTSNTLIGFSACERQRRNRTRRRRYSSICKVPRSGWAHFENGGCVLEEGGRFVLTAQPVVGTRERASCSYPELATDVQPDDRVLLADGTVELRSVHSTARGSR